MSEQSEYDAGLRVRRKRWLNSQVEVGEIQTADIAGPWGEWLSGFPWQAWGTLTLRWADPTPAQLARGFTRFVRWLRAEGNPDVSWYFAHETGALGRSHLHCLLGALAPDTPRSTLWRWWWDRYGRCEVRGYDPERGAAVYVAKYVSKTYAHYDLDLGGFDRWHDALTLPISTPSFKRTRGKRTA